MEVRCALVKELPAIEREGGGSIVAALKPTAAFTLVDKPRRVADRGGCGGPHAQNARVVGLSG